MYVGKLVKMRFYSMNNLKQRSAKWLQTRCSLEIEEQVGVCYSTAAQLTRPHLPQVCDWHPPASWQGTAALPAGRGGGEE